ncbi:MAG: tRNA (N6-threonylcarbamoyladenosine(37)-N6)-methyltransferase TrmO [Oscillibacter sp.]|nr:tRNA (N6-threonylcarbamoyladenosine(37)-N6)-methyltransferase TrmO [Oscillibacter sp.]
METAYQTQVIARIESAFSTKFGVPRQSGLVPELRARVVFEPPYRNRDALRGLDGFSHLWLIWVFDRSLPAAWSPTVRPPRLGGNRRMGVFATRSPFRPNPIGLSSVELEGVGEDPESGPVLYVRGADLVGGTPILDIKPYLPYTDAHPDARAGFAAERPKEALSVEIPPDLLARVPEDDRAALVGVLSHDPRPRYQHDPERVYGFGFAGLEVRFRVRGACLRVVDIAAVTGQSRGTSGTSSPSGPL